MYARAMNALSARPLVQTIWQGQAEEKEVGSGVGNYRQVHERSGV